MNRQPDPVAFINAVLPFLDGLPWDEPAHQPATPQTGRAQS